MGLRNVLRGFTDLFFPTLCLNCRRSISGEEALLCVACESDLTKSDSYLYPENEVTDRLAGRLPLVFGAAAYPFRDGSVCQRLIHALKYRNRPDIGRRLGERFGNLVRELDQLSDADGLVPVPIHDRRHHERGYNQAEHIALGLSESLGLPVYRDALRRRSFTGSQTRKGKLERLENVRNSFTAGTGDFRGRHLLLVDDVLTTGATLDFCGNILLDSHPGLRLSVLTLAVAEK